MRNNFVDQHASRVQSGFTLIELMVALTIALVLTVVTLPRVKEGLKQNVSTRTATMVKATFENARAQAIRTGRPFGVRMHRASTDVDAGNALNDPIVTAAHGANYCNRLSFVQMAFEYRGDIEGATAVFNNVLLTNGEIRPSITCSASTAGLLLAIGMKNIEPRDAPITQGNFLSLGEVANAYEVARPPARPAPGPPGPPPPAVEAINSNADVRVWLRDRAPITSSQSRFQTGDVLSFKFSTVPIASPMADVPMPGKAVIDLTCSGVGPNVSAFSPRAISDSDGFRGTAVRERPYKVGSTTEYEYRDVIVMFNGSGQLDSVYVDQYVAPPTPPPNATESDDYVYVRIAIADPVSLLIGEVDGVVLPETMAIYPERATAITTADIPASYAPTSDVTPNFNNTDNAWLTISPVSGRVDLSTVSGAYLGTHLATPGNPAPLTDRHPELLPAAIPTPTAADFIRGRLFDSRRLARGTIQ